MELDKYLLLQAKLDQLLKLSKYPSGGELLGGEEWRSKLAASEESCECVMSHRRGSRLQTSWKMRKTIGCEMENDYASLLQLLLSV